MSTRLMRQIQKLKLKQIEVSQKTGIKYKTVNRQCIQGIKTVRVAERYAPYLNCDPQELLEFTARSPRA